MKKFILSLSALFLSVAVIAQNSYKLQPNVTAKDYMANTIIFKVKETFRSSCTEQGVNIASLQKSFNTINVASVNKIFKNEQPPRDKFNKYGKPLTDLSLIYECKYSGGAPIEKAITALLSSNVLEYAEPHFIPVTTYTTNDPLATTAQQYHINRIAAYTGWNTSMGDTNVIVGITDTGTEPTHPDLQGNIKHNYADPINSIDDDGDGYTDNFSGWDVGMNDNNPTWQGDAHGVHVSGISSAATDNSVGIAGIGFKCKFLPVKIANASGALTAAYEGIKYAADHGCKVINCSWGGPGGGQYGQDICNYATFNKDVLVVIAAGNTGLDELFYPAAYDDVMAVANTQSNDIINTGSTYGFFVDVSAPGTNINSTYAGSSYVPLTGTSMASPVVAGVAAVVKSFFPSYSALQIKERIKVTADNHYGLPVNNQAGRKDKLGTGRVNLNRALTDPPSPSVIYSSLIFDDKNDDIFNLNDTLRIGGLFTNYLAPTIAATATLACPATVLALSNTISIGALSMMGTLSNTATPFAYRITTSFAPNTNLTFTLTVNDGTYTARSYITVMANRDYINIAENDISTTATSKGKIYYSGTGQSEGLGFLYQTLNLIYDGGLMIGVRDTMVSDCIRGVSGNDADFKISTNIYPVPGSPQSLLDTYAKYSDSSSVKIIGLTIEQRTWAWNTTVDKKYVIWEYTIKNNSANTYDSLYAGICSDWDIDAATFANNKSAYDAVNKMGYSWCTNPGGKYASVKLLTSSAPPNFYALDNVAGGGGGYDIASAGGFPTNIKYRTLTQSRLAAGSVSVTGNDVINVMSTGPYTVTPGQSIVVAFALIAGDSLLDLQNSAQAAQIKYWSLGVGVNEISLAENNVLVYPNPATDKIYVTIKNKVENDLFVYDVNGKLIYENKNSASFNIDTEKWSRGIYFIKVVNKNGVSTSKIVLH